MRTGFHGGIEVDTQGPFGDMASPIASESVDAVVQDVIGLVEAAGGAPGLTAESTFTECGLDSLKVLSLISKIERRYAIILEGEDEDDDDDPQTIGELAALVVRRLQVKP